MSSPVVQITKAPLEASTDLGFGGWLTDQMISWSIDRIGLSIRFVDGSQSFQESSHFNFWPILVRQSLTLGMALQALHMQTDINFGPKKWPQIYMEHLTWRWVSVSATYCVNQVHDSFPVVRISCWWAACLSGRHRSRRFVDAAFKADLNGALGDAGSG